MIVLRSKVTNELFGSFDSPADCGRYLDELRPLLAEDDYARDPLAWDVVEIQNTDGDPHAHPGVRSEITGMSHGRLEYVYLETYRDGSVMLHGTPYVACGNGSEHYPEIDNWVGVISAESWEQIYRANHSPILSDQENIENAVAAIVDDALGEFWEDPCVSEEAVEAAFQDMINEAAAGL